MLDTLHRRIAPGGWRIVQMSAGQRWRFAIASSVLIGAMVFGYYQFIDRYRISIDSQVYKCIPGTTFYLVDMKDRTPERDAIYAFQMPEAMQRHFEGHADYGIKYLRAVPGDNVQVDPERTTVNGITVGERLWLAEERGLDLSQFVRELILPEGQVWMMGQTRDSFDARYWGPIPETDLIGRAYPLF